MPSVDYYSILEMRKLSLNSLALGYPASQQPQEDLSSDHFALELSS